MKKMWQDLSFKMKLGILVVVLVSFVVFTVVTYNTLVEEVRDVGIDQATTMMLQGYKKELQDIVDVMALTLSAAIEEETSEQEIYQIFSNGIGDVRFFPDESGYYFIYKTGGVVFAHAAQPKLEGKNLIGFKDPQGKLLIEELDRVSRNGGGFVEYVWEKPNQGLKPKLSYARMIPGTKYWIGTGVYIDDIEEQANKILATIHTISSDFAKKMYLLLGAAWIVVVLPLSWIVVRSIAKPIHELTYIADEYSLGNLDLKIPSAGRKDEIGRLAMAIERLGASIKLAIDRLGSRENKKLYNTTSSQPAGLNRLFTDPKAVERLNGEINLLKQDNRKILGQGVLNLFERWDISTKDKCSILGLSDKDSHLLEDIRVGITVPDTIDLIDRIGLLLGIHKTLKNIYQEKYLSH